MLTPHSSWPVDIVWGLSRQLPPATQSTLHRTPPSPHASDSAGPVLHTLSARANHTRLPLWLMPLCEEMHYYMMKCATLLSTSFVCFTCKSYWALFSSKHLLDVATRYISVKISGSNEMLGFRLYPMHRVKELQAFSNVCMLSPLWVHVVHLVIPTVSCNKAAVYIIKAFGGEDAMKDSHWQNEVVADLCHLRYVPFSLNHSSMCCSGFPAWPGLKDCISSQLFGSHSSIVFGTELAPKAIDVLGPWWPASHGRTHLWGKKRKKVENNIKCSHWQYDTCYKIYKAPVMTHQHPHHRHQHPQQWLQSSTPPSHWQFHWLFLHDWLVSDPHCPTKPLHWQCWGKPSAWGLERSVTWDIELPWQCHCQGNYDTCWWWYQLKRMLACLLQMMLWQWDSRMWSNTKLGIENHSTMVVHRLTISTTCKKNKELLTPHQQTTPISSGMSSMVLRDVFHSSIPLLGLTAAWQVSELSSVSVSLR